MMASPYRCAKEELRCLLLAAVRLLQMVQQLVLQLLLLPRLLLARLLLLPCSDPCPPCPPLPASLAAPQEIDAYWLQRRVSKAFGDIDPNAAQKLAEEAFAALEVRRPAQREPPTGCGAAVPALLLGLGRSATFLLRL